MLLFNTIIVSLDSLTISATQSPTTSVSAIGSGTIPIVLGVICGTMLLIIIMMIIIVIIIIVILRKHKSEHLICLNNVLLSILLTDNYKEPEK